MIKLCDNSNAKHRNNKYCILVYSSDQYNIKYKVIMQCKWPRNYLGRRGSVRRLSRNSSRLRSWIYQSSNFYNYNEHKNCIYKISKHILLPSPDLALMALLLPGGQTLVLLSVKSTQRNVTCRCCWNRKYVQKLSKWMVIMENCKY